MRAPFEAPRRRSADRRAAGISPTRVCAPPARPLVGHRAILIAPPFPPWHLWHPNVSGDLCPHPALTFAPLRQPGESDQSALAWGGMLVTMVTAGRPGRAAHHRGPVSSLPGPGCEGEVRMDGGGGVGRQRWHLIPTPTSLGSAWVRQERAHAWCGQSQSWQGNGFPEVGLPPYFSCRCRGLSWSTCHPLSLQELPEFPPPPNHLAISAVLLGK